jgi:hypothetical protein
MTIDLTTYSSIETAIFISIDVPDYELLTFSNYHRSITIDGVAYTGLGQLLSITETTSELRVSATELTIVIGGVGNTNVSDVLTYGFKGAPVRVIRGIINPVTGQLLSIAGNPTGKFQGIVNNYSLNEDYSGQDATNTISFMCTSTVGLLSNKIAGRRTNPVDEKLFYPTDLSMDRVPNLANSNFNFGAVVK